MLLFYSNCVSCFNPKMRLFVAFIFIYFLSLHTFAKPNNETEQLLKKLGSAKDTAKVNTLNKLAYNLRRTNPSQALHYANDALTQSNSLQLYSESNDQVGIGYARNMLGLVYWNKGDYKQAEENYSIALTIFKTANDSNNMARPLCNLGIIYMEQGNLTKALENYLAALKIKEKLTGRFADILSWMFIATAVIKRFEEEGRKPEDKMFLDFSMAVAFQKIQDAFDGIFANMDVFGVYWFFKGPVRWWSRLNFVGLAPTDRLTHRCANALLSNEAQRDRLTKGMYLPTKPGESLARLESAFKAIRLAEGVDLKVRAAVAARKLNKKSKSLYEDGPGTRDHRGCRKATLGRDPGRRVLARRVPPLRDYAVS